VWKVENVEAVVGSLRSSDHRAEEDKIEVHYNPKVELVEAVQAVCNCRGQLVEEDQVKHKSHSVATVKRKLSDKVAGYMHACRRRALPKE
jgi:hypothetical protein